MLSLVEEWYSKYQEHIIAIYMYGSRILSYIHKPHDYDFLVFAKDYKSCYFLVSHSSELRDYGIHLLVFNVENYADHNLKYYDYLNYFVYPVKGFYSNANFNILTDNKTKRDIYKQALVSGLKQLPFWDPLNPGRTTKKLYHILTGLFILENFSYKLTAEQIKIINLAHDGECPRQ